MDKKEQEKAAQIFVDWLTERIEEKKAVVTGFDPLSPVAKAAKQTLEELLPYRRGALSLCEELGLEVRVEA